MTGRSSGVGRVGFVKELHRLDLSRIANCGAITYSLSRFFLIKADNYASV